MKSELVPLNGDPAIPITRDVTVVGRRDYCDVQVDHPSLSKRHCVLVRTDGLLMIRDLATTNGTKVNGQRVMWAALLPNDRLTLGGYKMRVYLGPDDVPGPSERAAAGRSGSPSRSTGNVGFAAPTPTPKTPASIASPPDDEDDVIQLESGDMLAEPGTRPARAESDDLILLD